MKSSQFLKEGFVEDAHNVHKDHEVQMAREELYHSAESALRLHKMLRNVSEEHGLEGWVSAKITLANDYLKTVLEYMEYHLMTDAAGEGDVAPEAEVMPMAEAAKWRDPKYKDKLYTQEPGDSDDYDNIGYGYDFPERPENDPGQKRRMGGVGSEFDHNDPLKKGQGIGRTGVKRNLNTAGKRKGLPSRDQITSLKGSIKDAHGKHHRPNLPEGVAEEVDTGQYDARKSNAKGATTPEQEKEFRKKVQAYGKELEQRQKEKAKGVAEDTSAGNVATLNNPTPKNKAKAGTLFGGTYQQPKVKAKK